MTINTVGALKEALLTLPDDMPVEVWSGSVESPVWFDATVSYDDDGCDVFRISTEN